ncbi:hypothetical protein [uncultured Lutibacter sp.]|uniref:hypothetical protein n=1 Tax=uncultured Lutibacter sp. TaxID=437739 RepID=UPI002607441F|nr:hypothetical protein [uncultured Lutibacter sp.]
MIKKSLMSLMLIFALNSYSQKEIAIFENSLLESSSSLKDVIPIVNDKTGDIALFLMDATKVYGYLLNDEFKLVKSLSSDDKNRKYKVLIGKGISDNNDYRIYFTNNRENKFASVKFSFDTKNIDYKEFELTSKKEMLVQTVTFNNQFYLISILKNTSKLNVYKFDVDGNYTRTELDFTSNNFINRYDKNTSIFSLITEGTGAYGFKKMINLKKINGNIPNSIEVTSELSKLYLRDNKVVFTFDENKQFTQILTINLNTFEKKVEHIEKPSFKSDLEKPVERTIISDGISKSTNSYLNGDNLFIISSTHNDFSFAVKNFNTHQMIKEYTVSNNDSITFKNTPIIQEGGTFEKYREMEKTKKFLRKITSGDIGVSVYRKNNTFQVTLGGKKDIKRSSGMMMPMGGFGMPIASVGSVSVFFSPTYFAYNSYTATKSTHIKGLFDLNFNHIKGEIEMNAFDKINNFEEKEHVSNNGETVFSYKDYFILGNYITKDKTYILRKFTD